MEKYRNIKKRVDRFSTRDLASHLLHCEHTIPALSACARGTTTSAPTYNIIFPPFCGAPASVGMSSRGGGTRVPFYLDGDVVAY